MHLGLPIELTSRSTKGETERAEAKDEPGCGKTLPANCNREDQTAEGICQPYPHQEVVKEKEVSEDGRVGSQDECKRVEEVDTLCIAGRRGVRSKVCIRTSSLELNEKREFLDNG